VHPLRERLAALRGPATPPRPLDARALAALAANPGCRRRAVLDAAGIDKGALAGRLGSPAPFGQSRFAFSRGHAFESRIMADGCAHLLALLGAAAADGDGAPVRAEVPDLSAAGPQGRVARTRLALAEAAPGGWTLLDHPMLALEVAGSTAYLEPDAVAVGPDGDWTVVEIKSFPILDGGADAVKVGAAARQSAVYALALDAIEPGRARSSFLLVCPRDFSNQPTAQWVDVRKQLAVTRRQLARLTRIEEITAALPPDTTFDLAPAADGAPTRAPGDLAAAVDTVPAAYAPECLSTCELAFHCRGRAREADRVEALGRSLRAELGGITTTAEVLAAATTTAGDPSDPAVAALRRASALRTEALSLAGSPPSIPPQPDADAQPGAGIPPQAEKGGAAQGALDPQPRTEAGAEPGAGAPPGGAGAASAAGTPPEAEIPPQADAAPAAQGAPDPRPQAEISGQPGAGIPPQAETDFAAQGRPDRRPQADGGTGTHPRAANPPQAEAMPAAQSAPDPRPQAEISVQRDTANPPQAEATPAAQSAPDPRPQAEISVQRGAADPPQADAAPAAQGAPDPRPQADVSGQGWAR
jgi:hypothetical protein